MCAVDTSHSSHTAPHMADLIKSPQDNVISNTALGVITCRKDTIQANANVSAMYQRQKGTAPIAADVRSQVLEWEPVFTMSSTAAVFLERAPKGKKNYELPVLSSLNGINARTAKAVQRMIRFVGFSRGEAANEHVKGNANGGLAIMVHGVLTVINSGVSSIAAGALVRIRAPTEAEAELQRIVGHHPGKTILATDTFKPSLDPADAKAMFIALMAETGKPLSPQLKVVADDVSDTASAWWKAQRALFAVFAAELAAQRQFAVSNDEQAALATGQQEFETVAELTGLFNSADASTFSMQQALLRRLFVMDVPSTTVAERDPSALFFQPATAEKPQSTRNIEMMQLQATAVQHSHDAIISGHAEQWISVIGMTPTGGMPGGSMDLLFWSNA